MYSDYLLIHSKVSGGDSFDRIFQKKYKPTDVFDKSDDIKSFQDTLKSSFENTSTTMHEIIDALKIFQNKLRT